MGKGLEDRLLDFAARVGKMVDAIPDTRLGRHIIGKSVVTAKANQTLGNRSTTSSHTET